MQTRIAMWSGPRNISTAMLRAWENRPDTFVCDEPLYAHYLQETGRTDHAGYQETLAAHSSDWREVVSWLTGPIPEGRPVFYQKQMAHHLHEPVELGWIDELTNCFLIRSPSEMLASLAEFLRSPTLEDTGLTQQVALYERVRTSTGTPPVVLDARDVLQNPEAMLSTLCEAVGVPFQHQMLSWPPGPRETDGAWGPYWYEKVYLTTEFAPYRPKIKPLPEHLTPILEQCQPLYDLLFANRLRLDS